MVPHKQRASAVSHTARASGAACVRALAWLGSKWAAARGLGTPVLADVLRRLMEQSKVNRKA